MHTHSIVNCVLSASHRIASLCLPSPVDYLSCVPPNPSNLIFRWGAVLPSEAQSSSAAPCFTQLPFCLRLPPVISLPLLLTESNQRLTPLSKSSLERYRSRVIENMPKLKHLDLKLITPEERALSSAMFKSPTMEEVLVLAEGVSRGLLCSSLMPFCSPSTLHFNSLSLYDFCHLLLVLPLLHNLALTFFCFSALPLTASDTGLSTPRPLKAQTSQKAKGLSATSSQKKRSSFTSRSPDLMNLFVDSTKSSKSALSELEGRAAVDGMSGKDWQGTSEISFSHLDGNVKTGGRIKKVCMGGMAIHADSEEWRWQWDSDECGGDREETIAWLAGVTEVTVRHMSVPRALSEVSVHAHRLPSVNALQLVDNGITTLHQVRTGCTASLHLNIIGIKLR
jgi:hypothetical protein